MILILEASLCRDIKIGGKENFDQRKGRTRRQHAPFSLSLSLSLLFLSLLGYLHEAISKSSRKGARNRKKGSGAAL
jgi:hypothetical protein